MNKYTDNRTALIDIELILYKCAAKAESTGTKLNDLTRMCDQAIDFIFYGCRANQFYLIVSGRNNFRKVLHPDYKAGRPPKPPLYSDLSNAIKEIHANRWFYHDQLEADDLLGIMATNGRTENPIICSIDKDMLGVQGWHYNWDKDAWPTHVSQAEADHNWLVQLLMGDSTDGIEGMKGIGKVKAEGLIKKHLPVTQFLTPPEAAKHIYEIEGFSLDAWRKCLETVTIFRNPMPKELLENELIAEIVKTIPSLKC